jgi:hypothetical protein
VRLLFDSLSSCSGLLKHAAATRMAAATVPTLTFTVLPSSQYPGAELADRGPRGPVQLTACADRRLWVSCRLLRVLLPVTSSTA